MSRRFGEIRQIAFVVPDIDAAIRYWTEDLGIGPFFMRRRIQFTDYRYKGEALESPVITIALGNSGRLQIELIEQHDDRPSIYRDFLATNPPGFQHASAWLTRADFDTRRAELIAQGLPVLQEGTVPPSSVRVVYFATEAAPGGFVYEMSDLADPLHYDRIQAIEQAAADWDGVAPVIGS